MLSQKQLEPLNTPFIGSTETPRTEEDENIEENDSALFSPAPLRVNYPIHHSLLKPFTPPYKKPDLSFWFYKNLHGAETQIANVMGLLSVITLILFFPCFLCCSLPLFLFAAYQRRTTVLLDDIKKELVLGRHSILLPFLRKEILAIPYDRIVRILPYQTNIHFQNQETYQPLIYLKDGTTIETEFTLDYDTCKLLCNELWEHLLMKPYQNGSHQWEGGDDTYRVMHSEPTSAIIQGEYSSHWPMPTNKNEEANA